MLCDFLSTQRHSQSEQSGILSHWRTLKGHDHPRRGEHLPRWDWTISLHTSQSTGGAGETENHWRAAKTHKIHTFCPSKCAIHSFFYCKQNASCENCSISPFVFLVVGVKDERLGEQVCACVRLKEGQTSSAEEIRAFCKGQVRMDDDWNDQNNKNQNTTIQFADWYLCFPSLLSRSLTSRSHTMCSL